MKIGLLLPSYVCVVLPRRDNGKKESGSPDPEALWTLMAVATGEFNFITGVILWKLKLARIEFHRLFLGRAPTTGQ